MDPLEAAALIVLLYLPLHFLVLRQLDRLESPEYLRQHGVVVVLERALQARTGVLGRYRDRPIWGSVTFKGMVYHFDRIARPQDKERTGPGELYLDPGLVYRLR